MKKILTKIALAACLLGIPAFVMADDEYNSLFAIEGGCSDVNLEVSSLTEEIQTNEFGNVGLKIGAESENYRIFLSARYYDANDFTKFYTAGAAFQYKFNFSREANFFLGGNIGKAYVRVAQKGTLPSVDMSTGYVGGDAGFNFHTSSMIDLEIGARYMHFNETMIRNGYLYDLSSLATAYASIIIKWKMD